jgi:hypothetical protein
VNLVYGPTRQRDDGNPNFPEQNPNLSQRNPSRIEQNPNPAERNPNSKASISFSESSLFKGYAALRRLGSTRYVRIRQHMICPVALHAGERLIAPDGSRSGFTRMAIVFELVAPLGMSEGGIVIDRALLDQPVQFSHSLIMSKQSRLIRALASAARSVTSESSSTARSHAAPNPGNSATCAADR